METPPEVVIFWSSPPPPSSVVLGTKSRLGKHSANEPQPQPVWCIPESRFSGLNMCRGGGGDLPLGSQGVCLSVAGSRW